MKIYGIEESHEHVWGICFEKRKWVIFYILKKWTPHISVLQREINCLNRETKIEIFGKTWTLTCETRVKVTFFMLFKCAFLPEKWIPTLLPKLTFCCGFKGNRLGQNVWDDRGIILGFHQKIDFDTCFAGQSQCFPENLDFHSLCWSNIFLFGGQTCEAFIFL